MAAGQGTRMKNPRMAKVMYTIDGIPLIEHVVRLVHEIGAGKIIAVVGHQRESVIAHLRSLHDGVEFAVQEKQLGTGHAVMQTESALKNFDGEVLILSGDVPLTQPGTIRKMVEFHRASQAVVTVLTAVLPNPSGYGRVIRDPEGKIARIVEEKDATVDERLVREINSGIYVFEKRRLFDAVSKITNDNAQGEYYLPDVFGMFAAQGFRMEPYRVDSFDEIRGVNTPEQLREMEMLYRQAKQKQ